MTVAVIEPGNGALDDPALGQHYKSFGMIGAADDFNFEARQDYFRQGFVESRPLIGSVGNALL